MKRSWVLALLAVALAVPARPQTALQVGRPDSYQARYGRPVDVDLDELVQDRSGYDRRAVRTRGRLEVGLTGQGQSWVFRARFGGQAVRLEPMPEISAQFVTEAASFAGRELEVVGVFNMTTLAAFDRAAAVGVINFWEFVARSDGKSKDKDKVAATLYSLESLLRNAHRRDGQWVRVVGQFRGRNLFGDLPTRSQRSVRDWVIKDDLYAVWISGHKPRGEGFRLDPKLKRDTGKWLSVVGRVDTRGDIVYIRAQSVILTRPPSEAAAAKPPPPPPARPKEPPVVVFSLPLDGEDKVSEERFIIQFSKDMDGATFDGRIVLRYAGPVLPGDRGFVGTSWSYDEGLRALTVSPGDVIRPGRVVELLLLQGIQDIDGLELVARPGRQYAEAVDVLRWSSVPGF